MVFCIEHNSKIIGSGYNMFEGVFRVWFKLYYTTWSVQMSGGSNQEDCDPNAKL